MLQGCQCAVSEETTCSVLSPLPASSSSWVNWGPVLGLSDSSAAKESTCKAGDPGLIPGSGRSPGERIGFPLLGFPGGSVSKESACNAGDLGSIPGLGRSPGEWPNNPLQYSCRENPREQKSLAGYSPRGQKESDTTTHSAEHSPAPAPQGVLSTAGGAAGTSPLQGAGVLIHRSWTRPRGGRRKRGRCRSRLPLPTPDCLGCWLDSSWPHAAQLLCSLLRSKCCPAHLGP